MLSRDEAAELLRSNITALGEIADEAEADDVRVRALAAQQRGLALAAQWAAGSEVTADDVDAVLDELAVKRRAAGR